MKEILCNSAYFGVTVSLIGYGAGIMLKKKFKYAFLNPLLISIIFVIGVVMLCGVDYESYENSAQYLSYLLTPATVCLAVPLYQQMTLLKKNLAAVACGILAGVLARCLCYAASKVYHNSNRNWRFRRTGRFGDHHGGCDHCYRRDRKCDRRGSLQAVSYL